MPRRKTRPRKQSFRELPAGLLEKAAGLGSAVQVGVAKRVKREHVERGDFLHLGIAVGEDGTLMFPAEPVVPPAEIGSRSRRNVEFKESLGSQRQEEAVRSLVASANADGREIIRSLKRYVARELYRCLPRPQPA